MLLDERVHPVQGLLEGVEGLDGGGRGPPVERGSTRSALVTAIAVGTLHTTPFTAAGWSTTASDRPCDVLLHPLAQHHIHGMPRSTPNQRDHLTEGVTLIHTE
uniref:Uncharacterized protein n=1 Tax=Streptomyces avermitilis TaxID=33903 RepID=A0A499V9Z7_STRAX|nr:hypothetical protein SAVMC3_37530 [Streptomyces avermitilis]